MFDSMQMESVREEAVVTKSAKAQKPASDDSARIPADVAARFVPIIRRLARSFAQRLPSQVSADDLIGAGSVALVELYRRMGHLPEEEFERAAVARVRGAMLDELRGADPLTRRMRQRERQIAQAGRHLEHQLGRWPTSVEIASHLKLSNEAYAASVRVSHASQVTSLEEGEVADRDALGPEDALNRTQSLERLRDAMGTLPPRLKKVLELHFGEGMTLRQIGTIFGVTEARISQLVGDAVKRLKVGCRSMSPPPMPG